MNNKGFIATSLIYSFFLIFITLFLTIIADYLQNKVLLNTIEKGIKEDINNTIGIQDFEVGDYVGLETEKNDCNDLNKFNYYVISKIDYNDNKIILYSLNATEDNNSEVTEDNSSATILKNLDTGYMNATYYNKILYSFNKDGTKSYKVSDSLCVKPREKDTDGTLKDTGISNTAEEKEYETSEGYVTKSCSGVSGYRKRMGLEVTDKDSMYFSNGRATKCVNSSEDAAGFIYLKKVKE